MHVEPTDMRAYHGQIFLILRREARVDQVAAAVPARLGQGDVNALVDGRRRWPMGMAPMPSARATAWLTGVGDGRALRERRCLTLARAARSVKCLGQPLNLTPQTIALAFEPRVLVAQAITFVARLLDLAAQPLQLPLSVVDRLRGVTSRHATVMADSRNKYKPKLWITPGDPLTSYAVGYFRQFLSNQGLRCELAWLFCEDVLFEGDRILIWTPIPTENSRCAADSYELGRQRNFGVCLHGFCLFQSRLCCYVMLPQDDLDGERMLMSNVAVKYSVASNLREAQPVKRPVASSASGFDGFNSRIPSKRTLLPDFVAMGAG
jgi:hypothetical protein